MGSSVLLSDEDTGDGTVPSPRMQLHDLVENLTEEAVPPVLTFLLLWLEGPRVLLPMWGLAVMTYVTS
jgi:hypothetical protein